MPTGLKDGALHPCPRSPNCVSSQSPAGTSHHIEPMRFTGDPKIALKRLKSIVLIMPDTALVSETERYLHVTYTTRFLRFVDDVEFLFEDDGTLHVRSASQTGYSDLGVNRRRVEQIRSLWTSQVL